MSRELLINAMPAEVRAALLVDGSLTDLIIERRRRASLVGNIYLGRVRRVMNGMEAAFVDIGLARAGFLGLDENRRSGAAAAPVHEGEAILVQVAKDAIGGKGVQLTRRLTLPGRFAVYTPDQPRVTVSRQIDDEPERARLTQLAATVAAPGEGFILRTAAIGVQAAELEADMRQLRDLWAEVSAARKTQEAPSQLHADLDPMLRILRDNALEDIDAIRVDDPPAARLAKDFCVRVMPAMADRVTLHAGPQALFDQYGIEEEIERACAQRLDLPSGGGIVIQTTEALTSIDVNSGRFEGAGGLEQTAFRTNMEAAREGARQIRLRNIAGLIVIDFIHMETRAHWDELVGAIRAIADADRNPTRILGVTAAGLVEITRRRRREPLQQSMTEPCGICGGAGHVRSLDAVAMDILRALKREASAARPGPLVVYAAPEVVDSLENGYAGAIREVSGGIGRALSLRAEASYGRESFDIVVDN